MEIIIGVLFIASQIWLGWSYGRMWLENKWLKGTVSDDGYTPVRYIFFSANGSSHAADLAKKCFVSHKNNDIGLLQFDEKDKCMKVIFANGDELILYDEGAQINCLEKKEIDGYANKIFVDSKLPQGTERAIIKELGLLNYAVTFGVMTNDKGENE